MIFIIERKNHRTITTFKRILNENKNNRLVIIVSLIFRIEIIKIILIIIIDEIIIFFENLSQIFFSNRFRQRRELVFSID